MSRHIAFFGTLRVEGEFWLAGGSRIGFRQ